MTVAFHELYHQTARALMPLYATDLVQAMVDANLDVATYDWLIHIYGQHPRPFTLADWLTYYQPNRLEPQWLAKLYEGGHLYEENGGFVLVEQTLKWLRDHLAADQEALAAIPLPSFELDTLVKRLYYLINQEVVKAHTRHLAALRPANAAHPLVKIDHALTELMTLSAESMDALTAQVFSEEEQAQLRADFEALLNHLYQHIGLKLWSLLRQTHEQFLNLVGKAERMVMSALGYSPIDVMVLYAAFALDPPTLEGVIRYYPCHNPEKLREVWLRLTEHGVIAQQEEHYALTVTGRDHIRKLFDGILAVFETVEGIPQEQIFELHSRLNHVLGAAIDNPEYDTFGAETTRRLQLPRPHPLGLMMQVVDDLLALRDDLRRNVWQSLEMTGVQWEAFWLIANYGLHSVEQIAGQLKDRGYKAQDYAQALVALLERGWLEYHDEKYYLSEDGKRVCIKMTADIDRALGKVWLVLEDALPNTYHALRTLYYGISKLVKKPVVVPSVD
ncbi:MAG: hypothetical protein CUN55_02410 [Phototrophicales bacterium]|nr:MAG: hypothetical protein CUN55_02410 [Phototrophicales bacterium]